MSRQLSGFFEIHRAGSVRSGTGLVQGKFDAHLKLLRNPFSPRVREYDFEPDDFDLKFSGIGDSRERNGLRYAMKIALRR